MKGRFRTRAREPELMDLPDIDPRRLERTLRQLALLNRYLLGTRSLLRRTILADIRRCPGRPPYTILDVGAGEPAIEVHLGSAADITGLPAYDFVFANLFLHHLRDAQVGPDLAAMLDRTRRLLVVSDLLRSRRSHFWYRLIAGLFLHGSFAAADGRLSIRRVEVRRGRPGRVCLIGRP